MAHPAGWPRQMSNILSTGKQTASGWSVTRVSVPPPAVEWFGTSDKHNHIDADPECNLYLFGGEIE